MDDTINLHVIGMRLKEAREKCKLTQAEVAEILGIHTNSYGNFERGTEKPSLNKIIQCSIIFHIQPDDLLNGCTPDLLLQTLSACNLKRTELQELISLLSKCSPELIHQLYIALSAVQKDSEKARSE